MTQVIQIPDVLLLVVAMIGFLVAGWVWVRLLMISLRIARGEQFDIEPGIASGMFLFIISSMWGGWWLSVAARLLTWAQEVLLR